MASKALKSPIIRHITTRGYAQAAPACKREAKFTTTVLSNKTVVAALDNGSPLTRVTVAFKAGSRYEPQTELGISHVLRSAAGLTTGNASGFIIQRQLSQIGASVSASGDREFIYYTLEATQENLNKALEYFNKLISCQEFRPWELDDNLPRLKYDLVALPPQVRAIDLLHKAAYRRGLGNSLFISPKKLGNISSESLQHYAASHLSTAACAVTVVGNTQDQACLVAQSLQLGNCEVNSEASKYFSGELRKEMGGDLAHVAVAVKGAPAGSQQALALAIAAKALGSGPSIKWGSYNSPLAKAIGNIGPFAAAGFNVSYSDCGLFGVVLSVPKDEASAAVKSAARYLKNGAISPNEIKGAKNQLKLQVLSEADDGSSLAEAFAAQGLNGGNIKSPAELAAAIDQISDSDVTQAFSNAAKTKLSMGAAGNLAGVPYVDEI